MANRIPCIVGWLFTATLFTGCSAADDGDDFSNNLFSDLAPLLALFGERVTMQFMSQSMGWADNIILAMAPLGIITAIVGAIRVGGPPSLKAVIGRARENLAVSETELMSSTSKEVCEVWNGREVVRCMGLAPVVEFICLLHYDDIEEFNKETAPTIEVLKLDEAIKKGYIKDCDDTREATTARTSEATAESAQDPESNEEIVQPSGSREPIGDEEQANSRQRSSIESQPQVPSPSTKGSVPSVPNSTKKLRKICIIRDVSGDSPNILLNCHPPAKEGELWAFAAIGTCLQLGVLVYSGLATYHSALQFRKDDKPVESYAYPCTAVGTVVLVLGMLLCGHVVESSTEEKRYEPAKEWKARMIWLQQKKTVSDQVFDSHMVYAQDDRQTIITSRRSKRHGKHQSTGGRSAEDDDPSAFLQLITICGTAVSLCGFVVQFVGLRGMHWSASIAQLGAVLVMVCIRAWVRRGLAKSPACEPLASGFELDWFTKKLGSIDRETWSGAEINMSDLVVNNAPSNGNNPGGKGTVSGQSLDNRWIVVTGGKSSLVPSDQMQAPATNFDEKTIFDAQTVLDARKQLARLADWRGPSSTEAVCLARAIECTMKALDMCLPKEAKSFTWNIQTRYIGSKEQTVSVRLSKQAGVWKVDATEMEAILSLWLSSVNEEDSAPPGPLNDGESEIDEKKHLEPNAGDDDWFRTKGSKAKQSLRLLGKRTPSLTRDLQWWIPRDLLSIFQVREEGVSSLRTALRVGQHRVVGYVHHKEGPSNHPPELQYLDMSNGGFDNDDHDGSNNDGCDNEEDNNTDYSDDESYDNNDGHPADYDGEGYRHDDFCDFCYSDDSDNYDDSDDSDDYDDSDDSDDSDDVDDGKNNNNDDNKNTARSLVLLGNESNQSLVALFSLDLYLTFMRAVAKAMVMPIPGGADEIRTDSNADDANWNVFTLRNSHLSKMVQDVHNIGLGSLDQIYLSIITPLSKEMKLPTVDAVINLALKNSRRNEELQKWQVAGDYLIWLFRLANRTFPKKSGIVAKATANLMEYQRLAECVLRLETTRQLLLFDSDDVRSATVHLRKLRSSLQKELKNVDPALERHVLTKYRILALKPYCAPIRNEEAQILLNTSNSIRSDPRDILERTAAHYAGLHDDMREFEEIMAGQRDISAQDLLGRTPLHYTCLCRDGRPDLVRGLIRLGAVLDTRARDGSTPLHYAAMRSDKEKVKLLIEAGATVDIGDLAGRSPIHTAAVHGHAAVVEYLWDKAKQELRDSSGWTILHLAAMSGKTSVVQFLIDRKIDMEAIDRNSRTALHLAALVGKECAVKLLIDHGANTETTDNSGMNALHLASMAGKAEVVESLINYGFHIEDEDNDEHTPLALAARSGHEDTVRLLAASGAICSKRNILLETPIHLASETRNTQDLIQFFLEEGIGINSGGFRDESPLMSAVRARQKSNAEFLLKKGANVNLTNRNGTTALWYAARNKDVRLVQLLLENGASTNVTFSRYGKVQTLSSMVNEWGNQEIIDLIRADIYALDEGMSQALEWFPIVFASDASSQDLF